MTTHQKSDLIGTAEYISPEMIDKGKSYFSSDLWALGIILFQVLHGFTPFVGSNQDNTVLNIINKNMTQISEVYLLLILECKSRCQRFNFKTNNL